MILSQIVAMSKNRVIGHKGGLPWHIPEDTQYFRDKTKGHCLVMGRKTFQSIKNPLKQRLNVVVTRDEDWSPSNAQDTVVVHSIQEALDFCQVQIKEKLWPEEIFIGGGSEIYRQTLDVTDRIYLTLIEEDYEGDTFFPEFDKDAYDLVSANPSRSASTPNFVFLTYERKKAR